MLRLVNRTDNFQFNPKEENEPLEEYLNREMERFKRELSIELQEIKKQVNTNEENI
jgi:hypothetical protein